MIRGRQKPKAIIMRNLIVNRAPGIYLKRSKTMKKQLQLIIIIIVLLTNLTGYGQNVEDSFTVDDITYEITEPSSDPSKPHTSTGKVKVVDYGGTAEEVTIPTKVNDQGIDYRVTAIGNEAFRDDQLTGVDMPHTVTSIGDNAFRNNDLTEVVIPLRVNSIGDSAFQDNPDLQTVIIRPDGAPNLNAPDLSRTNPFSNPAPTQIDLLVPTGMEDHYSGRGWTTFKSTNPATFTGDGDGITYAITSIAQRRVEIAGYDASAASSATEGVTIPQTVTDQGTEYKVTAIGYQAFYNKQLPQVTFSNTPTTPSNVTSIGEDAFYQNQLGNVDIPNSVTSIGQRAFGESNITELTIPNSITTISQWAFSRNAYTELTIPANVDSIGHQAFYENRELRLVTVEAVSPPTLHATAFDGSPLNLIDVVVPEVAIDEYRDPDNGWTRFKSITIGTFTDNRIKYVVSSSSPPEVEITDYDDDDGIATVVNIPSEVERNGTDYKVTAIGNDAFRRKGLTSVTFAGQSNVTRIGDHAFRDNQLTEVTIPGSVTSIGERAFWVEASPEDGLTSLTFVDQGELKFIGDKAFMNNKLTEVTIPSSVTRIENDAFQANELTEVTFSTSSELTHINEGVFKQNKLTSVTIPGRVDSIGNSAFSANHQLTQVTLPGSVTWIDIWVFSTMPIGGTVRLEGATPPSIEENTFKPFQDRCGRRHRQ